MKKWLFVAAAALLICLTPRLAFGQGPNFDRPEVKIEYDKFKDVTIVSIPPTFVIPPKPTGLQFGMLAGYKGASPTIPKPVIWTFFSVSESPLNKYAISHGVIVLADGERVKLGDTTHRNDFNAGFHIENMALIVPYETLEKIAKAKSVEIQIGDTDFKASEKLLEAMREFVKHFRP